MKKLLLGILLLSTTSTFAGVAVNGLKPIVTCVEAYKGGKSFEFYRTSPTKAIMIYHIFALERDSDVLFNDLNFTIDKTKMEITISGNAKIRYTDISNEVEEHEVELKMPIKKGRQYVPFTKKVNGVWLEGECYLDVNQVIKQK